MNRKVSVVGGAGNVGATVARAVSQKELADVVIVDIADTKAAGVALDIYQSCAVEGSASRVLGVSTKDFAETANSDVVVITSGMPRKPGMSRDDLLNVNYKIMQDVTAEIVGRFAGRPLELDEEMMEKIAAIIRNFAKRFRFDEAAVVEANRKQAMVPEGAVALDPVGTAPSDTATAPSGSSGTSPTSGSTTTYNGPYSGPYRPS